MKLILPMILALACIVLAVLLYQTDKQDTTRQETDAGAIADYSNKLSSAELQVAIRQSTVMTFSNRVEAGIFGVLTFSNQLVEAQSTIARDGEHTTNLIRQVAELRADNQSLERRIQGLTNQIAGLTSQLAVAGANLAQTNSDLVQAYKDYALLENRFRIDVAERIVAERKFNNPAELQAQTKKLKQNPAGVVSAESIYAGLNIEVKSNGSVHVIAPN